MSAEGTESEAGAGGEALKRNGRIVSLMMASSLTPPRALRQMVRPSMALVLYHSSFSTSTALLGLFLTATW